MFLDSTLSQLLKLHGLSIICFGNSGCSSKDAVILFLSWSPLFPNINCLDSISLILICHSLLTFHMTFFFFFENFSCSTEKEAILLLSWSILHIAFSKWKMSWILIHGFHFTQVVQVLCSKLIYSWVSGLSMKEASIFFFLWSILYLCKVFWF